MPFALNRSSSSLRKRIRRRNRKIAVFAAVIITTAVVYHYSSKFNTTRHRDGQLSGEVWMKKLLNGYLKRIKDNLGIIQKGF